MLQVADEGKTRPVVDLFPVVGGQCFEFPSWFDKCWLVVGIGIRPIIKCAMSLGGSVLECVEQKSKGGLADTGSPGKQR